MVLEIKRIIKERVVFLLCFPSNHYLNRYGVTQVNIICIFQ